MSLTVAYGALLTGVVVWFLLVRKLSAKSWETAGAIPDTSGERAPARVGLWIFLAVITSLFALFISAYYMRMGHGHGPVNDWTAVSEPKVLWFNTMLLVASSVAMQWARTSVMRGEFNRTREGLIVGGLLTLAFLGGQFFAWRENAGGRFLYAAESRDRLLLPAHGRAWPASARRTFVWGKTLLRMRRKDVEAIDVRMSIELCTVYWHYLLFVWLVLFALLLST